ncbi:hypothetical protein BH11PLA2_BH11PLA2_41660 [soil metagenome]
MNPRVCPPVDQLGKYLDAALPEVEREEVSAHIDSCEDCQSTLENLVADASIKSWSQETSKKPKPGLNDVFLAKLRRIVPQVAISPIQLLSGIIPRSANAESRDKEVQDLPTHIGGYEILGELGRGGMAIVYKARQNRLGRIVALKRLRFRDGDEAEIARFHREAEDIARLQHTNIVQVFEIGEADGQPFIALEYVRGGTFAEFLNGSPVEPQAAAVFLEKVARAIHHAHESGLIHRDLKPANVLLVQPTESLTDSDVRGDLARIEPKVADFGLARHVGEISGLTQPNMLAGTPAYLAPEQITLSTDHLTPACDVYTVGVLLFEALTGRPPLIGPTTLATLRLVERTEPVSPRSLQPRISRDLETICLTCLRKDPLKRYPSALAIAEDLRRYIEGRPIRARRVSGFEMAQLWCRRNPVLSTLSIALAASVLFGLFAALILLRDSRTSESIARESKEQALKSEALAHKLAAKADLNAHLANERAYGSDIRLANQMYINRQHSTLTNLLNGQRPESTDGVERRGFEWYYLWLASHPTHKMIQGLKGSVYEVCYSPNGTLLAITDDQSVHVADATTGRLIRQMEGQAPVQRTCFSANSELIAGASKEGIVYVWNAESGRQVHAFPGHQKGVAGVSFHPEGHWLACSSAAGGVKIWDLNSGSEVLTLNDLSWGIVCIGFSSDGKTMAAGGVNGIIQIFETGTWKERHKLKAHLADVTTLAFQPNSNTLVSCGGRSIKIWDAFSGKQTGFLPNHANSVTALQFSTDGRLLLSASLDRTLRVTEIESEMILNVLLGQDNFILGASIHPDGHTLASADGDNLVRLWDLRDIESEHRWKGHDKSIYGVAFSPDGQSLASGSAEGTRIWNFTSEIPERKLPHDGGVKCLAYDPTGRFLAAGGENSVVKIWNVATGTLMHNFTGHEKAVYSLSFSPDGKSLASAGGDGLAIVWNVESGQRLTTMPQQNAPALCLQFHPLESSLVVGYANGNVIAWEPLSGELIRKYTGHAKAVSCLDISSDGQHLLSGSQDHSIRIWNFASGERLQTATGHFNIITGARFSPDGRRFFSSSLDATVIVWETATGQPLLTFSEPHRVNALSISPDGWSIANAGDAGIICIRRSDPNLIPGPVK